MRYLFHSSKGSVAFLTAWSIYSLMIYFDRENQIEAWLEKTNQKRPKRGSGPQEGCFIFSRLTFVLLDLHFMSVGRHCDRNGGGTWSKRRRGEGEWEIKREVRAVQNAISLIIH